MNDSNPKFYWTPGSTPRGEYYAVTGTWHEGEMQCFEFHLFRTQSQELYLVDRQVMPVGDWQKVELLNEDQLHENGHRLAEACMIYDLILTSLSVWPRLVVVSEGQFTSRLIASAAAPSLIRSIAGSRCDAVHSFRQRLLSALGGGREFRDTRGQP